MTTAVARRRVLAKRAIRRRRGDEALAHPAPRGHGEGAELTMATAATPARRPEVVPVAGVRLEVEAGAEQDDVQEHGERPAAGASPGCAG